MWLPQEASAKDIASAVDIDFAGSFAAIQRFALSAQDFVITTNTSILVMLDDNDVEPTAADLIKI